MNEFVAFGGLPALTRNSLMRTGLTLRSLLAVVSDCVLPVAGVQVAWPTRSPLKAAGPAVTWKVALTLAPGATGPAMVAEVCAVPCTTEVQRLSGRPRLSLTALTGAPVVLVNVNVVACDEPGENVCSHGGVATAAAGASVSRATS